MGKIHGNGLTSPPFRARRTPLILADNLEAILENYDSDGVVERATERALIAKVDTHVEGKKHGEPAPCHWARSPPSCGSRSHPAIPQLSPGECRFSPERPAAVPAIAQEHLALRPHGGLRPMCAQTAHQRRDPVRRLHGLIAVALQMERRLDQRRWWFLVPVHVPRHLRQQLAPPAVLVQCEKEPGLRIALSDAERVEPPNIEPVHAMLRRVRRLLTPT